MKKQFSLILAVFVAFLFSFIELNAQHRNVQRTNQIPIINAACSDMGAENGWGSWKAATGDYSGGVVTFNATNITPTAPRFNITGGIGIDACTPGANPNDPPLPVVCPGFGNASIQLGQLQTNGTSGGCNKGCVEQLTYSLTVNPQDTNFIFSYAIVMEHTVHSQSDQPFVSLCIYDVNGNPIHCGCFTYTADISVPGSYQSNCNINSVAYYKPWTTVGVDLAPYIGQNLNIVITNADCGIGDHFTHSYWDFSCGNYSYKSEYCFGQQVTLCSPPADPSTNYTYKWYTTTQPYNYNYPWTLISGATGGCVTVTPHWGGIDTFMVEVEQPSGCNYAVIYIPKDTCMTIPNLLNGKVFSDANANCIFDGGDVSLGNWFVKAHNTSTSVNFYGTTHTNGNYSIIVPSGNFSLSLIPKTYWSQVCPLSSYSISVTSQDTINNLNFGDTISVFCSDLTVSVGISPFRKCLHSSLYIQYANNGNTPATNALLRINFDSKIIPISSTIPWDSISGNSYFWKIASIQPNQIVSFNIYDSISCNTQIGDTLYLSSIIYPITSDCIPDNNYDEYFNTVHSANDPNVKEASTTTNKIYLKQANILATDTINYTIHFQNTGNDTAFDVVIYDTLDSHLNVSSVISGVGSHPYTFELSGTGILKWTFHNILLPDSTTNELASHGFIKFRILQNPNNPNGTVIKNSAGIVFDFNAPVLTDTVVLTISNPTDVQNGTFEKATIKIFPNPTTGTFQITSDNLRMMNAEIYNVYGEKVYTSIINSQSSIINLDAPTGIYFLKITSQDGSSAVKKIIKE